MKISLFTVMVPDLTPEQIAPKIKQAGYSGVEWRIKHIPPEIKQQQPSFWGNNLCTFEPTETDAQRARTISEASGLELPTLGTYIDVGDLDAVQTSMRFAQIAGAKCIRVGTGKIGTAPFSQLFADTRAFLAEVEKLAQQFSVKALIETHHETISASASGAYRLVEGLNPDYIGVIYDPGNMVFEGYEDYRVGVQLLGDYLAHVHIKNANFDIPDDGGLWQPKFAPIENGVVDWHKLFTALNEVNYDGWYGLEDFSNARPSEEAITYNIRFLKDRLNEIT